VGNATYLVACGRFQIAEVRHVAAYPWRVPVFLSSVDRRENPELTGSCRFADPRREPYSMPTVNSKRIMVGFSVKLDAVLAMLHEQPERPNGET
jgi:hypothetical protein